MFQRHERRHKKEPDALRILDAHRNVVQKYKNKDDEHLDGSGSENAQLPTLRADHETYPPYIGPPSVPVKTKSAPSSIEASESFQEPVYDDGAPRVHRSGSDISKLLTSSTSALLAQRINPILEAYQADLPARVTEAFEKMFYRKLQACSEDEYCADSDEETGTYASHQLRALSASTGSSPLPSTPESEANANQNYASADQTKKLKSKKRPHDVTTGEDMWVHIYRMLYPHAKTIPSPYCKVYTEIPAELLDLVS
ncbi:hypothetical protein SLS57_008157 [Botryosphaeria dothidea]